MHRSRIRLRYHARSVGAVAVTSLLVMGAAHANAQESGSLRRNIILILSDDHRYDFMGFLKTPAFLETPGLDRMAAEGAHLRNAFVSTALCSPSRASILTGRYTHRHGVVDNDSEVQPGTVLFPQLLQSAGYKTAFIGKWHMGHHTDEPQPGFDHWVSFPGQGVYYDPALNVDGRRQKVKGYITDLLTEHAIEWLKKARPEPFFLYLSHKAVHAEFEPAKRHLGRYATVPVKYPPTMANTSENYREKPRWVREQRNSWHGVDYMYHGQMDFDTFYRRYTETLLALDESIARILDYLDRTGLAKSTLVLYMSDNGFSFGEHGLIDKRHAYEESIRVPMLAYAPGLIKPRTKVAELVQNVDVAPTLLELAGTPAPDDIDGASFLPLLRGESVPWRDEVLYEYFWEYYFPQTPTVFALRGERYKYIFYHGIWDLNEFYDLEQDSLERHNLIDSPAHQALIAGMQNRLFDKLAETNGMRIPIARPSGEQMAERGPASEPREE